jgi:hypothetical protein
MALLRCGVPYVSFAVLRLLAVCVTRAPHAASVSALTARPKADEATAAETAAMIKPRGILVQKVPAATEVKGDEPTAAAEACGGRKGKKAAAERQCATTPLATLVQFTGRVLAAVLLSCPHAAAAAVRVPAPSPFSTSATHKAAASPTVDGEMLYSTATEAVRPARSVVRACLELARCGRKNLNTPRPNSFYLLYRGGVPRLTGAARARAAGWAVHCGRCLSAGGGEL